MYRLSALRRALASPHLVARECNRLYHRRLYRRLYNTAGVDLFAADWDTLVLLDACRYDLFAARSDLPGRLERRVSRGSHTVEFLRGNFADRDCRETVYVTASPQYYRHREALGTRFHAVEHLWADHGWDGYENTVLPATTTQAALAAHERYPEKRVLVHYMQPHYPFIGVDVTGRERGAGVDVWELLAAGDAEVSSEAVVAAYEANLDAALPAVAELLAEISGRTVVSSDHGNMLGERATPVPVPEWGHPPGIYTPELVTVPWLVHDRGPRRTVTVGTPETATDPDPATDSDAPDDADAAVVEERLRHLGYR